MTYLPDAVVGNAYASEFGWDVLCDLVDFETRMAGQAEEHAAAAVLAERFEEAGLRDVGTEAFPIDGWWRGSSSLTTSGSHEQAYEKDYQVIALPGSPSGTASGPVVDVGYGRPEDFEAADCEGAVVVASSETPSEYGRWIHRMEKYVSAAEAGAVAFCFRNHVPGCLPATGEVGYDNRPGPIPAVGLSKELGARLQRHGGDGEVTATVEVTCRNEPSESVNVWGDVGPETEEAVLLTAHVDTHDIAEGANDNGSGAALAAEIGRLLTSVEDALETRVRVLVFGSEEIGLKGAYHAMETSELDAVKCVVNLDGVGVGETLTVNTSEFDAIGAVFEDVADDLGVPLETDDTIAPHGDQWAFVQEGVPGTFIGATSGESGRGWGHTHADTLDKIDFQVLRRHAVTVAAAVCGFAASDQAVPRRTREETRDRLDAGYAHELKLGGRWPYD